MIMRWFLVISLGCCRITDDGGRPSSVKTLEGSQLSLPSLYLQHLDQSMTRYQTVDQWDANFYKVCSRRKQMSYYVKSSMIIPGMGIYQMRS